MSKVVYCSKVTPAPDCDHVIRGIDENDVLKKAAFHASQHGLDPTPELLSEVSAAIEDEEEN